jgi:hypothetical protein
MQTTCNLSILSCTAWFDMVALPKYRYPLPKYMDVVLISIALPGTADLNQRAFAELGYSTTAGEDQLDTTLYCEVK